MVRTTHSRAAISHGVSIATEHQSGADGIVVKVGRTVTRLKPFARATSKATRLLGTVGGSAHECVGECGCQTEPSNQEYSFEVCMVQSEFPSVH